MLGLSMLYTIDRRMRAGIPEKSDSLFANVNIILSGDFGQLPLVGDITFMLR